MKRFNIKAAVLAAMVITAEAALAFNVTVDNDSPDYDCPYGEYKEGVCIGNFPTFTRDTADRFVIPIRSAAPTSVFQLTLEDAHLEGDTFTYSLFEQSGTVSRADDGSITVEGLTLDAAAGWRGFILEPSIEWELVYVQSRRTITNGRDFSLWDHVPDLRRLDGSFPESDLALETKDGRQKIIHACTTSEKICVIDNPKVSPDAKRIAYWEGIGDSLQPVKTVALGAIPTGGMDIRALVECRLWIHELETGDSYPLTEGHCDRTPEWIDNDTLVFSSNRERHYVTKTSKGEKNPAQGNEYGYSYHLHRGDIVGKRLVNIENIGPHEAIAINPDVTTGCSITYTAHNAGVQNRLETTVQNASYIARCDCNGAQCEAEFQKHGHPVFEAWALLPNLTKDPELRGIQPSTKAIREVVEIEKGTFCATSYYGANNQSSGCPYCWLDEPGEGALTRREIPAAQQWADSDQPGTGQFIPSSTWLPLPWCQSQDQRARRDLQGRPMGKASGLFAHTDGEFGFTWCRGECYTHAIDVTVRRHPPNGIDYTDPANLAGEPPAHRMIALSKVRQANDPFDESQIVILSSHPDYHRYSAAQIRPYRVFYGQDAPTRLPRLKPGRALLIAEDVHTHEVFPQPNRTSKFAREAIQGNLEPGKIAFQCLDYIKPHISRPTQFGYEFEKRDCVPVIEGTTVQEVDADKAFQMAWFDEAMKELARDHATHSLRSGETRCCASCHTHSETGFKPCGEGND